MENSIRILVPPLKDSLNFKILLVDYYINFNAKTKNKITKYLLEACLNNYELDLFKIDSSEIKVIENIKYDGGFLI